MRQRPTPREDVPPNKRVEREHIVPPTIGFLRRQGVSGFRVSCTVDHCRRSKDVTFDAARISDDMLFPMIERSGRLICSACGSRRVTIMPDWPRVQSASGTLDKE